MRIDGVKIELRNFDFRVWLDNVLLDFNLHSTTNVDSGEVLNTTRIAICKGLKFIIIPSSNDENIHRCIVRGSLHKYFNEGNHNANDFSFKDLCFVICDLYQTFNINPYYAYFKNLESGVNVLTPISSKNVLKNIVAYGNAEFITLAIDNARIGKQIKKQEYTIKIYDKGKQYRLEKDNLTRFEIAIKSTKYLKKFNIVTLSDLFDLSKIQLLGMALINVWKDVIYYDKKLNWKVLSNVEQKKMLYYATPRNWTEFNRMQRIRAKGLFHKYMAKSGVTNHHAKITSLLTFKYKELEAEKCIRFTQKNNDFGSIEMYTFYACKYHRKTYTFSIENTTLIFCSKFSLDNTPIESTQEDTLKHPKSISQILEVTNQNERQYLSGEKENKEKDSLSYFARNSKESEPSQKTKSCRTCNININHKRSDSIYCSKRCNNSYHSKIRKMKRHELLRIEKNNLAFALENIKEYFLLRIEYVEDNQTYSDELEKKEVLPSSEWIRKVSKVSIYGYGEKIVLTSYRARKFIKKLAGHNKSLFKPKSKVNG